MLRTLIFAISLAALTGCSLIPNNDPPVAVNNVSEYCAIAGRPTLARLCLPGDIIVVDETTGFAECTALTRRAAEIIGGEIAKFDKRCPPSDDVTPEEAIAALGLPAPREKTPAQ